MSDFPTRPTLDRSQDEGTALAPADVINFVGGGVTATTSANVMTVTVPLGAGGVTAVTGTAPIASSGGLTPAISIADTAVTPAAYGGAATVGTFTVDAKGRLTAAADAAIAIAAAAVTSGTLPVARGGTNSAVALNSSRIMVSDAGAVVEAAALTNGQLLVGSTGAAPVAAALAGTANQVVVALGAGTVTLSTPQDIGTGSTPTFTGAAMNGGDVTALDELAFNDAAAGASATGRLRRNATNLEFHDGTASRVVYRAGGTDVAVADGGTGASDAGTARTNLGLAIGSNVQAWDADLDAVAALAASGLVARTGAGTASARTLSAGTGTTVTNGDGVAGNPSVNVTYGTSASTATQGDDVRIPPAPSGAGKLAYDTGAAYAATAAGTSSQVLHGAAGSPTWGAVALATEVSGILPVANGGTATAYVGVEGMLASVAGVDLNVGTKTTLYTVPAGKTAIITRVVIRNASISLDTARFGFGFNSGPANDFAAPFVHSELTVSTRYAIVPAPAGGVQGAAVRGAETEVFGVQADILQGAAATVTIDVFGYLF